MDASSQEGYGWRPPPTAPPLSPDAVGRVRRIGGRAGALLSAGFALLLPAAALAWIALQLAERGLFGRPAPLEPLLLAPLLLAALLLSAGWTLSVRELRRLADARPHRSTAVAAGVVAAAGVLVLLAMIALWFVFGQLGIEPVEWPLAAIGFVIALIVGALVGRIVWPRVAAGRRQWPRA